jgi:hypothetical protein
MAGLIGLQRDAAGTSVMPEKVAEGSVEPGIQNVWAQTGLRLSPE